MLRKPEATSEKIVVSEGVKGVRSAAGSRLPHMPTLDGLRAFAVVAVLLYHGGLDWLPGGFLGVEVFFVISGYLITALLLAEWGHRGRIDLKAFWFRRARRLLPALYLVLVATLAFAVVFLPGEVAGLRADVLASLGYVTNWYLVICQESYFEAVGRPSLLKHLWSLAIEEQFYLIWPILLAVLMGFGAYRWRRRWTLVLTLAGAAGSALLMAFLYRPDLDPSRLYYGTDTRASGLLIGAALAFLWEPASLYTREAHRKASQGKLSWSSPLLLDILGAAALACLTLMYLRVGEFDPFLYRGGFLVVGLATAAMIAAIVHPRTLLGTGLLGLAPLCWIGVRSYGIYLWHWPVFMVTRPGLDVPLDGPALLAVRLAATVALADISYRFVEVPIRRGALGRAWRELRDAEGSRRRRLGGIWIATATPIVVLCAALGVAAARMESPKAPDYIASMEAIHTEAPSSRGAPEKQDTSPAPGQSALREQAAAEDGRETAAAPDQETADAPPEKEAKDAVMDAAKDGRTGKPETRFAGPVSAIGDSVMLGSAQPLQRQVDISVMDAEVGLQAPEAIDILQSRRATGQLGQVVIVHLGDNGRITERQFDQIMRVLSGVPRVVVVNVTVPRPWEQSNNQVLSDGVERYPNAVLADWHAASADQPELFIKDGTHPQPPGQRLYARVIAERVYAT